MVLTYTGGSWEIHVDVPSTGKLLEGHGAVYVHRLD